MANGFRELSPAAKDPIVAASLEWPAFLAAHPGAVNLTVGVIANPATMRAYRPEAVQRAYPEALQQTDKDSDYGYQGPTGNSNLLTAFGVFAFGRENYEASRDDMLACQTMGGTGALWMASELLCKLIEPDETGRVPMLMEPGYPNHSAIFSDKGFNVTSYPHIDPATGTYNHAAALEAIAAMPPHSPVLLQVCGHNDDGADRTPEQWDEILDIAQCNNLVLVLDAAYTGLARGLAIDTYALREAARRGIFTFVAATGSKLFGVYGERLGMMYALNARQHLGDDQLGDLDTTYRAEVRRTITGVPSLVAKVVALAVKDPAFTQELEATRLRILANRAAFAAAAGEKVVGVSTGWGMYARMRQEGFTPSQITALNEHGLHVLPTSRMNFGGMRDSEQAERIGLIVADVLSGS